MTGPARSLVVRDLGRVEYRAALARQLDLVDRRAREEIEDQLLLLEHDAVVTVGRGARASEFASLAVPVVECERGGEATWHGPGQLVGYPILALREGERDLHRYLRNLEEVLILALDDLGFPFEPGGGTRRNPPHTGVWIGAGKVASIGIAVRRWVTYHGFALNVDCDLAAFRPFRPCGLDPSVMASLASVAGRAFERSVVVERVVARFVEVFSRERAAPE